MHPTIEAVGILGDVSEASGLHWVGRPLCCLFFWCVEVTSDLLTFESGGACAKKARVDSLIERKEVT